MSCGWSCLRLGDETRDGEALRGDGLRPFFFAAKAEHTAAAAPLRHVRQPRLSRHDFMTSTTASQNESKGMPSMRSALSRATISDSVDEWDTTVCFLHTALRGKNVLGPTRAAYNPVVDF